MPVVLLTLLSTPLPILSSYVESDYSTESKKPPDSLTSCVLQTSYIILHLLLKTVLKPLNPFGFNSNFNYSLYENYICIFFKSFSLLLKVSEHWASLQIYKRWLTGWTWERFPWIRWGKSSQESSFTPHVSVFWDQYPSVIFCSMDFTMSVLRFQP
jgi:hypothetical protein